MPGAIYIYTSPGVLARALSLSGPRESVNRSFSSSLCPRHYMLMPAGPLWEFARGFCRLAAGERLESDFNVLLLPLPGGREEERNAGTFVIKVVVMRKAGSSATDFDIVSEQCLTFTFYCGRPRFRCAARSRGNRSRIWAKSSSLNRKSLKWLVSFPRSVYRESRFNLAHLFKIYRGKMHPKSAVRYHYLTSKSYTFYYFFFRISRNLSRNLSKPLFKRFFYSQFKIVTVYHLQLRCINSSEY